MKRYLSKEEEKFILDNVDKEKAKYTPEEVLEEWYIRNPVAVNKRYDWNWNHFNYGEKEDILIEFVWGMNHMNSEEENQENYRKNTDYFSGEITLSEETISRIKETGMYVFKLYEDVKEFNGLKPIYCFIPNTDELEEYKNRMGRFETDAFVIYENENKNNELYISCETATIWRDDRRISLYEGEISINGKMYALRKDEDRFAYTDALCIAKPSLEECRDFVFEKNTNWEFSENEILTFAEEISKHYNYKENYMTKDSR